MTAPYRPTGGAKKDRVGKIPMPSPFNSKDYDLSEVPHIPDNMTEAPPSPFDTPGYTVPEYKKGGTK